MDSLNETTSHDSYNYITEAVQKYGDYQSLELPLMGSPLLFFGIVAFLIGLIKLAPLYSKAVAPYDIKPFMMIFDGVLFGLSGAGFAIGIVLTSWGMDSFDCKAIDPKTNNLNIISLKYIAFLYTGIKVIWLLKAIITALRGRLVSNSYLAYMCGHVLFAYCGCVFYPGGIFVFWPLVDDFVDIWAFGYLVMTTASRDLRPAAYWKSIITAMRYIAAIALFAQGLYFYRIPNCGLLHLQMTQICVNAAVVSGMSYNFLFGANKKKVL